MNRPSQEPELPNEPACNRSAEEFMRLLVRHQPQIYYTILALIGSWSDAEDVLQETIAVMWRKYDHFQPGSNFLAWALTVARFQSMSFIKRRAQLGSRHIWLSQRALEALARPIEARAATAEARAEALNKCLAKLPEHQRLLLARRYEEGATVKSIARNLGRTVQAVYKSLNRLHDVLLQCVRQTLSSEKP
jgi:RNA polymerase sigma-70 factor, ECF subfamily